MKPSTACELVGFALLAWAAWLLAPVAGIAVAGVALLFIGYATDDGQVAVSARKMIEPFARRRAMWKAKRAARRDARGNRPARAA